MSFINGAPAHSYIFLFKVRIHRIRTDGGKVSHIRLEWKGERQKHHTSMKKRSH